MSLWTISHVLSLGKAETGECTTVLALVRIAQDQNPVYFNRLEIPQFWIVFHLDLNEECRPVFPAVYALPGNDAYHDTGRTCAGGNICDRPEFLHHNQWSIAGVRPSCTTLCLIPVYHVYRNFYRGS